MTMPHNDGIDEMTEQDTFRKWQKETQDAEYRSTEYFVHDAIIEGLENAADTLGDLGFHPSDDHLKLAYDSIAFTSSFTEIDAVREWFEARGYRW